MGLALALTVGCSDDSDSEDPGGNTESTEGDESSADAEEGGSDADEGEPDAGESTEGEEEGGEDTFEPNPEICDNNIDDDGDGAADCNDTECINEPVCLPDPEICDNGVDDNNNGLVDCDEPTCSVEPECGGVPCDQYNTCLAEEGCNCTFGLDCPEPGTAEYTNCFQSCLLNEFCATECASAGEGEAAVIITEYLACVDDNCDGQASQACVFGPCLSEWAFCNHTGDGDCEDFLECTAACPANEDDCPFNCQLATTPEGIVDVITRDNCSIALCNVDNDPSAIDSAQCFEFAEALACADVAGTCTDPEDYTGALECVDIVACVSDCNLSSAECINACLIQSSFDTILGFGDLAECVLDTCGTTADDLTGECVSSAAFGDCALQLQSCNGGSIPEICGNDNDDDGDGAADCEDSDCSEDPVCVSSIRFLHMVPAAGAVDIFVGSDTPTFEDVTFGAGSPYATPLAGFVSSKLTEADAPETTIATVNALLPAGEFRSVVAYAEGDGAETLLLVDDQPSDVAEGSIHVRLVHTLEAAGTVDVLDITDPRDASTVAEDFSIGDATAYLPLNADQAYTLGLDANDDGAADFSVEIPALPSQSVINAYVGPSLTTASGLGVYVQAADSSITVLELVSLSEDD